MTFSRTERGFGLLKHNAFASNNEVRLAQHSSSIGDYEDSLQRPGSSALWIGQDHHLNREEVAQFIAHLQSWLKTGSLEIQKEVK